VCFQLLEKPRLLRNLVLLVLKLLLQSGYLVNNISHYESPVRHTREGFPSL
jgi:hypothetical protein